MGKLKSKHTPWKRQPDLIRRTGRKLLKNIWIPRFSLLLHEANQLLLCVVSNFSHVQLFVDIMDCSSPGSSVHGILQARILEWVAMLSSRGLPNLGIKPTSLRPPALAGRFFTTSSTWKAQLTSLPSLQKRLKFLFLKGVKTELLDNQLRVRTWPKTEGFLNHMHPERWMQRPSSYPHKTCAQARS